MDIEGIQGIYDTISDIWTKAEPYLDWARENWVTIALTGEIVGAIVAVMLRRYRLGFGWLIAAVCTIWMGARP